MNPQRKGKSYAAPKTTPRKTIAVREGTHRITRASDENAVLNMVLQHRSFGGVHPAVETEEERGAHIWYHFGRTLALTPTLDLAPRPPALLTENCGTQFLVSP